MKENILSIFYEGIRRRIAKNKIDELKVCLLELSWECIFRFHPYPSPSHMSLVSIEHLRTPDSLVIESRMTYELENTTLSLTCPSRHCAGVRQATEGYSFGKNSIACRVLCL